MDPRGERGFTPSPWTMPPVVGGLTPVWMDSGRIHADKFPMMALQRPGTRLRTVYPSGGTSPGFAPTTLADLARFFDAA